MKVSHLMLCQVAEPCQSRSRWHVKVCDKQHWSITHQHGPMQPGIFWYPGIGTEQYLNVWVWDPESLLDIGIHYNDLMCSLLFLSTFFFMVLLYTVGDSSWTDLKSFCNLSFCHVPGIDVKSVCWREKTWNPFAMFSSILCSGNLC